MPLSGLERLTNRSIRNILSSCRKLQRINLEDCTELDVLSNRNVVSLIGENCKQLEDILLSGSNYTNESMKCVFTNCNNLEAVVMDGCNQVSDESLIALGQYCLGLKVLCVVDC